MTPSTCHGLQQLHHTTQLNTTQHNATQLNTTQHNTTQHNTTQHNTTQHNTTQQNITHHNTGLYTTHYNIMGNTNPTHNIHHSTARDSTPEQSQHDTSAYGTAHSTWESIKILPFDIHPGILTAPLFCLPHLCTHFPLLCSEGARVALVVRLVIGPLVFKHHPSDLWGPHRLALNSGGLEEANGSGGLRGRPRNANATVLWV